MIELLQAFLACHCSNSTLSAADTLPSEKLQKRFAASDNVYEVGRVLKELPSSPPLSAAGRPLFYSAPRINRGALNDGEYDLRVGDALKRAADESDTK